MSVLLCMGIILVLLWTIAYLPVFGNAGNPDNNEVSARYIEQGLKETGAMNMVRLAATLYAPFPEQRIKCIHGAGHHQAHTDIQRQCLSLH